MTTPTPHGQVPEVLIYAELPKHAATGLGEEYESFDQNGKPMGKAYQNLVYYTDDQMRDFADRTHALRMQAAPKAAPGEQLTREQIREVFMAHGFTIKEGQTDLKQYVYDAAYALLGLVAAPQQEAQEPSHRETVDVVGVRSNGEHVNLGKIAMPPRMKAREIAIEQFGSFKDDDGSDAEMCFGALEYFLEWLIQQGWSKAPQPAPAPLSEREAFEAWIKKDGGDLGTFGTPPNMHYRNSAVNNAWVAWKARAALAAQGGE